MARFSPSSAVQTAMYSLFYNWGHFVGRKPCCVVWTSLVLAVLAAIRLPLGGCRAQQHDGIEGALDAPTS